jgi:Ca2+-binding RTX toxin-like protein
MTTPRLVLASAAFALALASAPALANHGGVSRSAMRVQATSARGATASGGSFTLTINTVGSGANEIAITRNGNNYVIDSNGAIPPPTQVTGCSNPVSNPNRLRCALGRLSGFDIAVGAGNDTVTASKSVIVPTRMSGGAGLDDLYGGSNSDKLVGGADGDKLVGRGGADALYGGNGEDLLLGDAGKDILRGNAGHDVLKGGPGRDDVRQ